MAPDRRRNTDDNDISAGNSICVMMRKGRLCAACREFDHISEIFTFCVPYFFVVSRLSLSLSRSLSLSLSAKRSQAPERWMSGKIKMSTHKNTDSYQSHAICQIGWDAAIARLTNQSFNIRYSTHRPDTQMGHRLRWRSQVNIYHLDSWCLCMWLDCIGNLSKQCDCIRNKLYRLAVWPAPIIFLPSNFSRFPYARRLWLTILKSTKTNPIWYSLSWCIQESVSLEWRLAARTDMSLTACIHGWAIHTDGALPGHANLFRTGFRHAHHSLNCILYWSSVRARAHTQRFVCCQKTKGGVPSHTVFECDPLCVYLSIHICICSHAPCVCYVICWNVVVAAMSAGRIIDWPECEDDPRWPIYRCPSNVMTECQHMTNNRHSGLRPAEPKTREPCEANTTTQTNPNAKSHSSDKPNRIIKLNMTWTSENKAQNWHFAQWGIRFWAAECVMLRICTGCDRYGNRCVRLKGSTVLFFPQTHTTIEWKWSLYVWQA